MAHGTTGLKSTFASVNPYSNEVVREFPSLTEDEIDRAIDAAHRAFGAWRDERVERRAAVVAKAAELMRERYEDRGAHHYPRDGKADTPQPRRARSDHPDPGVLRREGPGADRGRATGDGRTGRQSLRNEPLGVPSHHPALELSGLSGSSHQRSEPRPRKHDPPQACARACRSAPSRSRSCSPTPAHPGVFSPICSLDVLDISLTIVEHPLVRACFTHR